MVSEVNRPHLDVGTHAASATPRHSDGTKSPTHLFDGPQGLPLSRTPYKHSKLEKKGPVTEALKHTIQTQMYKKPR